MRVFVTGASGYIGSQVTAELLSRGHQVIGLSRSDATDRTLRAIGVEPHRGSLEDHESLKAGAAKADGVIHLAFIHDFSDPQRQIRTDVEAIEAIGNALVGSDRPLVNASGLLALVQGRAVTEDDAAPVGWPRGPAEEKMLAFAGRGVRTSIVRLPPSVHSNADRHGFIPRIIERAREHHLSVYVGDGSSRWSAVHRNDAARLFCLALEKGKPGSRFHAVGDEGVLTRDIADVIGRRLNVPFVSKAPNQAGDVLGFLGMFFGMDARATAVKTRAALGWKPKEIGLLTDLDSDDYFAPAAAH